MTAMEGRNAAARNFQGKDKERRPYGKAPLEFGLHGAIEVVSKIAQEGKSLSESRLAIVLGNTITSSAFTKKIRTLTSYGLLAEQPGAQFGLTELALAIALPRSLQAQAEAKKQAFLRIEPFNLLFNQHKGKLLPADEFLRNILEQEADIPRDVSQEWVKHFKDGARTAGLFYNRGDGKIQIAESPILNDSTASPSEDKPNERGNAPLQVAGDDKIQVAESTEVVRQASMQQQSQSQQITTPGHYTRIDLSDGRRAEIIIPDKLTSKDANKLKRALEGIAVIIESMVSEE
jgi:hypothetical protein